MKCGTLRYGGGEGESEKRDVTLVKKLSLFTHHYSENYRTFKLIIVHFVPISDENNINVSYFWHFFNLSSLFFPFRVRQLIGPNDRSDRRSGEGGKPKVWRKMGGGGGVREVWHFVTGREGKTCRKRCDVIFDVTPYRINFKIYLVARQIKNIFTLTFFAHFSLPP